MILCCKGYLEEEVVLNEHGLGLFVHACNQTTSSIGIVPKNNLNIRIKTEPGADATVYVRFVYIYIQFRYPDINIPLHRLQP